MRTLEAPVSIRYPADYKSAIRQIENLRYFVHSRGAASGVVGCCGWCAVGGAAPRQSAALLNGVSGQRHATQPEGPWQIQTADARGLLMGSSVKPLETVGRDLEPSGVLRLNFLESWVWEYLLWRLRICARDK